MTAIEHIRSDITRVIADAIVNAANRELRPGGGVDGAIHAAGGPEIALEARAIADRQGHLDTGEAVATTAGALPARYVIHTVGPVWSRQPEATAVRLLADCYRNSLDLAVELACDSVAFPNISTGVYGFPKRLAAETAIDSVRSWIEIQPESLEKITFVAFDEENQSIYDELLGN